MEDYNKTLWTIISVFITIIVGTVLLWSMADQNYNSLNSAGKVNESVTVAGNTANLSNTHVISVTYFGNNSHSMYVGVHVNYTSWATAADNLKGAYPKTLLVSGTNVSAGTYNVSYTYYPSEYIRDNGSRTVIALIPLLFAIAILVGVVAYAVYMFGKGF